MRRLTVLTLLVVLALLAGGAGAWGAAQGGIELTNGSGRVAMTLRGAALGTVGQGRITIRVNSAKTDVRVEGDDVRTRLLADGGTLYIGRNLRFRVYKGGWRVVLDGSAINASAVGRGVVGLRGTGQYSLNGGSVAAWPGEWKTIRLGGGRGRG
jgi:hypothetical protein